VKLKSADKIAKNPRQIRGKSNPPQVFTPDLSETVAASEDVCGNFRQCLEDPALDGADRHAAGEIPAAAIDVRLVPLESGGTPAAAVVCLS
jgi:hypothetical protein